MFIALPILTLGVLRLHPVQSWLAHKAATFYSNKWGATIHLGGLTLTYGLDLEATDLYLLDRRQDTLFKASRLVAQVDYVRPRSGKFVFKSARFDDLFVGIRRNAADSLYNYQFLIEAFPPADTNQKKELLFWLQQLKLSNARFLYQDGVRQYHTSGMDYANIQVEGIQLNAQDLVFSGDSLELAIQQLAAREKSGFQITEFSTQALVKKGYVGAYNLQLATPNSEMDLDLELFLHGPKALRNFIHQVEMKASIRRSMLQMADLVCFAPTISGMNNLLWFQGAATGTVADFTAQQLELEFGKETHFKGRVRMQGLPDIRKTYANIDIQRLETSVSDSRYFHLPGTAPTNTLLLPQQLERMGRLLFNGAYKGYYNDFDAQIDLLSDLGQVSGELNMKNNRQDQLLEYEGQLNAHRFDLGQLLALESNLGKLNLNTEFKGQGVSAENLYLQLDGVVDSLDFRGNNYNSLDIKGVLANNRFVGWLDLQDEKVQLDFSGMVDLTPHSPTFNFRSKILNADLAGLNLYKGKQSGRLSTQVDVNFSGKDLDDVQGRIRALNTRYQVAENVYTMDSLVVVASRDSLSKQTILQSDFMAAELVGDFSIQKMISSLRSLSMDYLPALEKMDGPVWGSEYPQDCKFNMRLTDTRQLSELFLPQLYLPAGFEMNGQFASTSRLWALEAKAADVVVNGIRLHHWYLNSHSQPDALWLKTGAQEMLFKEPSQRDSLRLGIETFALSASVAADTLLYKVSWDDTSRLDRNRGILKGLVDMHAWPAVYTHIDQAKAVINDSIWRVTDDNFLQADSSGLHFNQMGFIGNHQQLILNGFISNRPEDVLDLFFKGFDISNFDMLLRQKRVDLDGVVNGRMSLSGLNETPGFVTDLRIDSLHLNQQYLGTALLKSEWVTEDKAIDVKTDVVYQGNAARDTTLHIRGMYYPASVVNNYLFSIEAKNVMLAALEPYFTAFSSKVGGTASGRLVMTGRTATPRLNGKMSVSRGEMLIDYTNVNYSFADDIYFGDDYFGFNNITLYDPFGHSGVLSGKVKHQAFRDWELDLHLQHDGIAGLNTQVQQNELFYGRAFATGEMHITGPVEDIHMDIDASTAKGTEFYLPINYSVGLANTDFIHFVNQQDTTAEDLSAELTAEAFGFKLGLGLAVNSDANIQIYLPYSMGTIKVTGDGNIKLDVNEKSEFSIYGDYTMEKGSFLFMLRNLVSRNFTIKRGSMISFTGDPYDANINLEAVYKIKASVQGLQAEGTLNQRIPVDCIIGLKGKLVNPDISFRIDLPNSDEEIKDIVYSAIDTTNKVEMNQQMLSLLVLNSFSGAGPGTGLANTVNINSYELLSNTVNNWLSQISKDFNIGVNYYRPGDALSTEELEVALSTQLLDDRVSIDGNFGVSSYKNEQSQKASDIVGDVNVEVKLTPDGRFRVVAFNKTNTYDQLSESAPYTQGVGIFFRKEFDHIGELFSGKNKNARKQKRARKRKARKEKSQNLKPSIQ